MERAGGAPCDVGTLKAYQQAAAARVQCGEHRLLVADVWWAGLSDATTAFSTGCQVAKCAWFTCAATRKALAAIVKLRFKPVLEGKNEESAT